MLAPSLRELQALFWNAIASEPGAARPSPWLTQWVRAGAQLAPEECVGIYAEMYWARIRDVLHGDFTRTASLLGEERFDTVARAYLCARPSRHPSIARVGEALPDFIAECPPADVPPFAADLARLEWARVEAFTAGDAEPLRLCDLERVPADAWPALPLRAVPSLTVLELGWPVQRFFAELGCEAQSPEPTVLRVWRRECLVFHSTVDEMEQAALRQLVAGASFASIAEVCADPQDAAALLARWLEDGIIQGGQA